MVDYCKLKQEDCMHRGVDMAQCECDETDSSWCAQWRYRFDIPDADINLVDACQNDPDARGQNTSDFCDTFGSVDDAKVAKPRYACATETGAPCDIAVDETASELSWRYSNAAYLCTHAMSDADRELLAQELSWLSSGALGALDACVENTLTCDAFEACSTNWLETVLPTWRRDSYDDLPQT